MQENNVIYFTEEQLKEIYDFQPEKNKPVFQEYLKDKDIKHIDVVKLVETYSFKIPDDIWDLYGTHVAMLKKQEDERNGKSWDTFDIPDEFKYTEEQKAEIRKISTMTEAEIDEYIKDVKFCESNLDDLKNKAVTSNKGK